MESRPVPSLRPHPLNGRIYGEESVPEDFLASVRERGIMTPLAVKPDGTIISGHRRWRAAVALRLESVPVQVVSYSSDLDEREAVLEFNRQREKSFSQRMAEAEELKAIETERARVRQATSTGGPRPQLVEMLPQAEDKGKTRDRVAEAVGIGSGRTYAKAAKVWEAAKSGDIIAQALVDKLDRGQTTVHAAYKQVKRTEDIARLPAAPPPPEGLYDVILADPPWQYDFAETETRAIENQYPTMAVDELKVLPVPSAEESVLFLWATAPKLREALAVMAAWGFEYKTCAVWDKERIGMGYWFRGQHELLLVGVKGGFPAPAPEVRASSVIREARTGHSAKPALVYGLIEAMCPGRRYLELFARSKRDGWTSWGNEAA